jgi:hypothetical protein
VGCKTYISGPSGQSYLNENKFRENNLEVVWFDYSRYKNYTQLYPPFTHNVSIVDLLFSLGGQSADYLLSHKG